MRKKDSRVWSTLAWTVLYFAVILGGMLVALLIALGRVKVRHLERIPRRRRILYAPNHPGMLEPLLLGLLFNRPFPSRHSWSIPWSTPDKSNFYDRWYWAWARLRCIPFPRGDRRGELRALGQCERVLRAEFRLILFGESGRTSSNNIDGTPAVRVKSPSGRHEVREFKDGIGRLLLGVESCDVLPIWIEGTDKVIPRGHWVPRFWRAPITIHIGNPWHYVRPNGRVSKRDLKKIAHPLTLKVQDLVLATADEADIARRGRKRRPLLATNQNGWFFYFKCYS